MPYPLPGCWTTARMHSAALPAGLRPPSSPELPAMQHVAQPPADRTSAISVRHGCGCRTRARLQHRRPSPREELGSKYNIKMLKVHRLIRLKKRKKICDKEIPWWVFPAGSGQAWRGPGSSFFSHTEVIPSSNLRHSQH